MRYTRDGGVIPSSVPVGRKRSDSHSRMFGIYRGSVIRTLYPDDPANRSGERVEYVVKCLGQEYRNAVNLKEGGGVYNFNERIRKQTEKAFAGRIDPQSSRNEDLDGEAVFVMFVDGHGDYPVIVGAQQHPRQATKASKANGLCDVMEFNGIEVKIDKDSNYTITSVGRKSPDGAVENPAAVGTMIKIADNGDVEVVSKNDITFSTESGTHKFYKDGKHEIKSATAELMDLLVQLVDTLTKVQTMTLMGPQKFLPNFILDLTLIKTKLETFKV